VYVTAPDRACAETLAESLVRERLCACANLLGPIRSVYRWKGRVERGREVALVLKTTRAAFPRLRARLRKLHPYETPCIVALPIAGGDPGFLAWIAAETRRPARG
jgi:periplasmic divalent cation tolerance protein